MELSVWGFVKKGGSQGEVTGNISRIWVVEFVQCGIKIASPSIESSFRSISVGISNN